MFKDIKNNNSQDEETASLEESSHDEKEIELLPSSLIADPTEREKLTNPEYNSVNSDSDEEEKSRGEDQSTLAIESEELKRKIWKIWEKITNPHPIITITFWILLMVIAEILWVRSLETCTTDLIKCVEMLGKTEKIF